MPNRIDWEVADIGSVMLNVAGEVTRRRLRKHKPGLQSGPVLLLVSGLGFGLGQSCVA